MIYDDDRILVVAAHPDDEVLGCGGTICAISNMFPGAEISAIILSEGLTSRENDFIRFTKADIDSVKEDSLEAARILGYKNVFFEDLPNNRLDSMDLLDVIKIIERYVTDLQPTVVFTHHHSDINIAHRITYQAVLTACRPMEGTSVKKLLSFEIPSSTEWAFPTYQSVFSPNVFYEIGEGNIEKKIMAMQAYKMEKRTLPHPRSPEVLRAIALRWGSVAGMGYAESFELIYDRHINKTMEQNA